MVRKESARGEGTRDNRPLAQDLGASSSLAGDRESDRFAPIRLRREGILSQ